MADAYHPLLGRSHPLGGRSHPLAAENIIVPAPGLVGLGDEVSWYCPSLDTAGFETTILTDFGAAGVNGAIAGATWVDDGLAFDGNDGVDLGTPASSIGTDKTLSLWIAADVWNSNEVVANLEQFGLTAGLLSGATPYLVFSTEIVSRFGFDVSTLVGGAWHHVAVTVLANSALDKMYLDGVEQGRDVANGWAVQSGNTLGNRNGDTFYNGTLDDVRLYNRVLTQAEITHLAQGAGIQGPA